MFSSAAAVVFPFFSYLIAKIIVRYLDCIEVFVIYIYTRKNKDNSRNLRGSWLLLNSDNFLFICLLSFFSL